MGRRFLSVSSHKTACRPSSSVLCCSVCLYTQLVLALSRTWSSMNIENPFVPKERMVCECLFTRQLAASRPPCLAAFWCENYFSLFVRLSQKKERSSCPLPPSGELGMGSISLTAVVSFWFRTCAGVLVFFPHLIWVFRERR